MDWVSRIQKAIDYIENNLDGDIDIAAAAKAAYSSEYHFQRVFSILCGFTVGDYIRMRRLSLAAAELANTDKKVIDIALKYGYDSHESFTRAFTRFHGVTPTEAKQGKGIKVFSPLSVKLTLSGGTAMDYRIEKTEPFDIICRRRRINKHAAFTATADASAFWEECTADGTLRELEKYMPDKLKFNGLLGICFAGDTEAAEEFPYGIGAEYNGRDITDDGFEVVTVPARTFAVFPCKGKLPDVFPETYKRILTEFFPQNSRYEYHYGIELEFYPEGSLNAPDYTYEIWIAVKEKEGV